VIGENRLVKITDGVYNIAEYTYDALGRRIEMKVYDSGQVDSVTRYYYNNNWQVLAETDYDSTGPTETQLRDYIYGNYIDEVLIMTDDSNAEHYYGHDHIFSVVTLIEPDGDVEERYEYDAYGKPYFYSDAFVLLSPQESAYNNTVLFAGYRHDPEADKYHVRHRDYGYYTGRFLQQDPFGIVPNAVGPNVFATTTQYQDGANLYEYARSMPTARLDPMGLYWAGPLQAECGDKRLMYDVAKTFYVTSQPWRAMLDGWFYETIKSPVEYIGDEHAVNKDIKANSGFQELMEAWVAKNYAKAELYESDHWDVNRDSIFWEYYYPFAHAGGAQAYDDAMDFIGSYTATIKHKWQGSNCNVNTTVEIKNTTSWESACRTFKALGGKFHNFANHEQKKGPCLEDYYSQRSYGGNLVQTYRFRVENIPINKRCALCKW